jgi:hypothetical protein
LGFFVQVRELQEEVDEARQRCEDLEAERVELETRLTGAMARNEQDSINRYQYCYIS